MYSGAGHYCEMNPGRVMQDPDANIVTRQTVECRN